MKFILTLFVLLLLPAAARAQTCYKCIFGSGDPYCDQADREQAATGCSQAIVITGDGREIILGCNLAGDGQCYSCGVGDCEQGRLKHHAPKRINVAFRQEQQFNLSVDLATVREVAAVNPELGYALSMLMSGKLKFKENSGNRLKWGKFNIDPAFAEFWLHPKAPGASEYYAQIVAEMRDSGAQNKIVEVGYELHGNYLVLVSINGDVRYRTKRYRLTLRQDQLVPVPNGGSGQKI